MEVSHRPTRRTWYTDTIFRMIALHECFPKTDGATAALIMTEDKAKALGFKPKAYLRQVLCRKLATDFHAFLGNLFTFLKILKTSFFSGISIDCYLCHQGVRTAFFPRFRPAYATPKVLQRAKLSLSDIDVFEYHEAFAVRRLTPL